MPVKPSEREEEYFAKMEYKKKPIVLSREQPRSATLARVEWCRAISEKKQTAYGVGIKYFEYYGG